MTQFLIPFRGLKTGKSRWKTAQKTDLMLSFLSRSLEAVSKVVGRESTVLVTPDQRACSLFGQYPHYLTRGEGLNQDLEEARTALWDPALSGDLAVLLPDLPRLNSEDIRALLDFASEAEVIVCPDHHGIGTNALLLKPGDCLDFCFEGASADRHREQALRVGLRTADFRRSGLEEDCDEDADLERLSLI